MLLSSHIFEIAAHIFENFGMLHCCFRLRKQQIFSLIKVLKKYSINILREIEIHENNLGNVIKLKIQIYLFIITKFNLFLLVSILSGILSTGNTSRMSII
jgi:hypothetical protein